MRTTITLDPDVAKNLKEYTKQRNLKPKEAINNLVRRGLLSESKESSSPKKKFAVKPFASKGLRHGYSYDRFDYMLKDTEDDFYTKKMSL